VRRDAEAAPPADPHALHAALEAGDDPPRPERERDRSSGLEHVTAVQGADVPHDDTGAAGGDRPVARPVVLDLDALQAGSTSTRASL